MIAGMMHEKFYISGTYANSRLGVHVGWACHKGTFADCMPVFNDRKDVVLIFAGENFADDDVVRRMGRKSLAADQTNAGYLAHLYEEDKNKFFNRLNGWFSGIVIDLQREEVVLFNDRYAMGRIYYYENEHEFLFASEAKSLLSIRPELRSIDPAGLGELISCGCTLENKSLFGKVSLLPAGSAWSFRQNGKYEKSVYFNRHDWETQDVLEPESFYRRLGETFHALLPRYLQSSNGLGMSLTGGLDTRAILACSKIAPGGMPCYTFGGLGRDTFDVKVARKVASECGHSHEVLRIDETFFANFSSIAEKTVLVSDGYWDVCGAHEVYLNAKARSIAPVRLTGNYGSEVLRSVRNFKASLPDRRLVSDDFAHYVQQAQETFMATSDMNEVSFAVFKEIPWRLYGSLNAAQSQLTVRSPYMDNDLIRLVYQAPADALVGNELMLRLIADNNRILSRITTDMGDGPSRYVWMSLWRKLLRKFLFKLEWYYSSGLPDWMMKINNSARVLRTERMFLGWHRYLFYRLWFQNELSGCVKEILLDKQTRERPYWKKDSLEKMMAKHMSGDGNYTNEINKVLTVELIHRHIINKSCP